MTTTARQFYSPPPFAVLPVSRLLIAGDAHSTDDGPVAIRVTSCVPASLQSKLAATVSVSGTGRAHRNEHPRKSERSHAHDHWHYARVPESHLPADLSQQWWMETKRMIDRGYDRFIARHHLNRHSPEWSVSNWGVCAGVRDEKP